jgi:hypothetical protein
MIMFGAGKLIAIPTVDANGSAILVPTPVAIAVMQDVSVDFDFETKTLHGEKQFAIAVGRGKAKIGWKAKSGDFNGAALGSLFLGSQPTASRKAVVVDEAHTIPASAGPYTITIDPPSAGVFVADLGVMNALTGQLLTRVDSAPATGQYSVVPATGVYTFAAADASGPILISHEYLIASSATSQLYNITNQLMGNAPSFAAIFYNQFGGKTLAMKLNCSVMGKLALPFKNDDFTMSDMDAESYADAAGNIGYICQY